MRLDLRLQAKSPSLTSVSGEVSSGARMPFSLVWSWLLTESCWKMAWALAPAARAMQAAMNFMVVVVMMGLLMVMLVKKMVK